MRTLRGILKLRSYVKGTESGPRLKHRIAKMFDKVDVEFCKTVTQGYLKRIELCKQFLGGQGGYLIEIVCHG